MENIWEKALEVLRSEVNDQVFNAWFLPIKQGCVKDDSICLDIPNKFFESWIRDKYFSLIKSAIHQSCGKELEVAFQVREELEALLPSKTVDPPRRPASPQQPSMKEKDGTMGWLKSVLSGGRQMPESRYQEIGLNPKNTFDNFVVGKSNQFAHAASLAVSDKLSKSYNPLFLYGGVGLGKTHLMQAIGHRITTTTPRAQMLYISSEEFTNQLITAIRTKSTAKFKNMYRNVDILLVDDIQFIAGKESTQEEFFHTFNALYDAHKQIVITCDRPPQEIPTLEERLVSRFAWGLIADVQPPDFETRIAILEKKSEAESVHLPKDVLFFLAEKVKTNIREMEGALIRVVAYSRLTANAISVDLAREVLRGMIVEEEKKVNIDLIQKVVANYFQLTVENIKSKKRTRAIAYPRQIAMYLSRELTEHSLPDIGGSFGGRDHTTALHAYDKISKERESNEDTRKVLEKLIVQIKK